MATQYNYETIHMNNEIIETNMKLLDKLLERSLITQYDYDEELKILAEAARITLNRKEKEMQEASNKKKSFFFMLKKYKRGVSTPLFFYLLNSLFSFIYYRIEYNVVNH